MDPYQPCSDITDLSEFSPAHMIYLKPEARISITVALPLVRLPGRTISNWEVMERLRQMATPDEFTLIKVSRTTVEFIRFDAEIEHKPKLLAVITRIDGKSIRLSGFPEPLKIRAAEAKPEFPSRHDWDRFFRDNKAMNEMKSGERPDTLYIQGLPKKWFVNKRGGSEPSESVLVQIFETFGEIRCVDIPSLDPYRAKMKESISGLRSTLSGLPDDTFDAYIQYREYICFVKAMDALRGMRLVYKDGIKAFSASIKVDFDKSKHLSDMSIRRRAIEREKLMDQERENEEAKRREEEAVQQALEEEEQRKEEAKRLKGERRKEREEKRKQRILKKLKKKEAEQMSIKIAIEERKLLMAQRKLESIRLLDDLFERVKIEAQKEATKPKESELDKKLTKVKMKNAEKQRKKELKDQRKREKLLTKERKLRKKLVSKIKLAEEQNLEERKEKLRRTIEEKDNYVKLKKHTDEEDYDINSSFYGHFPSIPSFGYPFDFYRGFPFGGLRGRFFPRRSFRGFRGAFNNSYQWIKPTDQETEHDEKTMDEGDSSLNEHGEMDFYNPYLMLMLRGKGRASRRPFKSRGFSRDQKMGVSSCMNPNVPTTSFYMSKINGHYYRRFKDCYYNERGEKSSRSSSRSSDRKICRKVLSRSRTRSNSSSVSRSRSRSRSRTRSRSNKRRTTRSRSRTRSTDKDKRENYKKVGTKDRTKRTGKGNSPTHISETQHEETKESERNKEFVKVTELHQKTETEVLSHKSREATGEIDKRKETTQKLGDETMKVQEGPANTENDNSELSLSLSDSEEWAAGSPERKEAPLNDPDWSRRSKLRSPVTNFRSRSRPRFRSKRRSRSRSKSPIGRKNNPVISSVVVKCETIGKKKRSVSPRREVVKRR